jgi:hypothetical protein
MDDIGPKKYFESIQTYIQGNESQLTENTKAKQAFFKGLRVCSIAVTGTIGLPCATILCVPAGIVVSARRCQLSISIHKVNYDNNKISLSKLIKNILIELTLGFAIGTIAFSCTAFADISLSIIGILNKISYSGDETLTTRLSLYSLPLLH